MTVAILDGPLGTELGRRGVDLEERCWSARANAESPAIIAEIHREHVAAGAEVVTANTFRTTPRALSGTALSADELTRRAVAIARDCVGAGRVAGSLTTLEDCYRPDLVPDRSTLDREHEGQARRLTAAGVDLVMIETMNSTREAVAATAAVTAIDAIAWVAFVVAGEARLLSGEDVLDAARECVAAGAEVILVNCSALDDTTVALRRLTALDVPLGAYPNAGRPPTGPAGPLNPTLTPGGLADWAVAMRAEVDLGAVGSCCGTGASHIKALVEALGPR